MHVGFKTDKGIIRSSNEDACFVLLHDKVYILADGVGGGNSGEIASRTAVSEIANYVVKHPLDGLEDKYEIVGYLRDAIEQANHRIYDLAMEHEENSGMATTAIIVYVHKGKRRFYSIDRNIRFIFIKHLGKLYRNVGFKMLVIVTLHGLAVKHSALDIEICRLESTAICVIINVLKGAVAYKLAVIVKREISLVNGYHISRNVDVGFEIRVGKLYGKVT